MGKLLPEEVLVCILKSLDKADVTFRSIDVQRCFYKLKRDGRYSNFLKSFRFSGSPVAPFSDVLDSALFNLQYADKLKRLNPDLISYSFTQNFEQYFEKINKEKLNEGDRNLCNEMAKEVQSFLNA